MSHHPAARFGELLDKHLLLAHYSRNVLLGPQARHEWVAPDRLPIPAMA